MTSSGLASWQLSYQISPITFVGGIAGNGTGTLPVVSLLQPSASSIGNEAGSSYLALEEYFAQFEPLPGSNLFRAEWPKYPLANQYIAANAGVSEELTVSILMKCPARPGYVTWAQKLSIITSLKNSLDQHFALGGTFNVATPSFLYTNLLLRELKDATAGESEQPQSVYQWDFEAPLLTTQQAAAAQGVLLARNTAGAMIPGDPPMMTGLGMTVGQPPTLGSVSLTPGSQNLQAASASNQTPSSVTGG